MTAPWLLTSEGQAARVPGSWLYLSKEQTTVVVCAALASNCLPQCGCDCVLALKECSCITVLQQAPA